jgi:superfamily II DNA or RNA helicase
MTAAVQVGTNWVVDAECGDADPALFEHDQVGEEAAAYCRRCTVRLHCLDWAIAGDQPGAWGGLPLTRRRELRAAGWTRAAGLPAIEVAAPKPARQPPADAPPADAPPADAPPADAPPADAPPAEARRLARGRRLAVPSPTWSGPDPTLRPRPDDQEEALAKILVGMAGGPRGKLLAACGTGKTLLGRWTAERSGAGLVLVAVSTLDLISQTLREWRRAPGWPFDAIVVCSDPTTTAGVAERGGDGPDDEDLVDPFARQAPAGAVPVTTDADQVAAFLRRRRPGRAQLVLSTYHSAAVVAQAARRAHVRFDLAVLDEAHRLAGRTSPAFATLLHDRALPATTRLFMTATPRVVGPRHGGELLSMDDPAMFGRSWYELPFGEAIRRGLLVDYQVLVVARHHGSPDTDTDDAGEQFALGALRDAAAQFGLRRVLTFHGRVWKARRFAAAVQAAGLPDGRRVVASHVSGKTPAAARQARLQRLAAARKNELVVVANARCLSEGIDVPAVDAVLFADPRNSEIDIVQAIGRVLRRAPGKQRGLIIIPAVLPAGDDDDTALTAGPFATVWTVLRALRAHDERFAVEVDAALRAVARHGDQRHARRVGARQVRFLVPDDVDVDQVRVRLVEEVGAGWERMFGLLERYAAKHGTARVPRGYQTPDGTALGEWVYRQMAAHHAGRLQPDRTERLAALPGWVWDFEEARWQANLDVVHTLAEQWAATGQGWDCDALSTHPEPWPRSGRTAGVWLAEQRISERAGQLAEPRKQALHRLPGYRCSVLPPGDQAMVDALRVYLAREGHANPPTGHWEAGLPLGGWLDAIRLRRVLGRLDAALADELAAVTPRPSTAGALRWQRPRTLWQFHYQALCAFVARHGHACVVGDHIEHVQVTDLVLGRYTIAVALGRWGTVQRQQHRQGRMPADRAALLERHPGWRWEVDPAERVAVNLGSTPHGGTRTGYVKGCRCPDCTAANTRDYHQREQRRRVGLPGTDLVDVGPARQHLQNLVGQGATQKSLARAAEVNVKTVAETLDGTLRRIQPETQRRLLGLTLDAVRDAARPGSPVDAAPTWALLDDLIGRGWPKAWLASELGIGRALQLRKTQITAGSADKVTALHARIGDRRPPRRRWRAPLPPLAEMEAAETRDAAAPATLVSAIPARARLAKLQQRGVAAAAVEAAAGVPAELVEAITDGTVLAVPSATAAAILAITGDRFQTLASGGTRMEVDACHGGGARSATTCPAVRGGSAAAVDEGSR